MHRILIANRGEIAVRIIRACRDMGLESVAVYSDADRAARHVAMADYACAIGPPPPAESYLRIDRILEAAAVTGADAIHPGYGFLSENATLSYACRDAGITFIGPPPEAIATMGSKTVARRTAMAAGVPVVPGTDGSIGPDVEIEEIAEAAGRVGFPLMVKAVAGGGGKGMRVVRAESELEGAIRAARSEAGSAFGDSAIYLERHLERPRHIEVQLLADAYGVILPFVERECSIQRRHQKVVEETPSPVVSPALRAELAAAAAAVARKAGYVNAGTVEFLLDADGHFYFLEMNTRLQVEHPITEAVTGVDLVQWQIRIARGERLTLDPARLLVPNGHAIECRVYAEDPDAGFLPSPGRIDRIRVPAGPGIRDDSGIETGGHVPVFYDSLISKLIAWGEDRAQATSRMQRALEEYQVHGIRTTLPFFRWLLAQRAFVDAAFHTEYLDELLQSRQGEPFEPAHMSLEQVALAAVALTSGADRPEPVAPASSSHAWNGAQSVHEVASESGWRRAARREGLRH